MTQHPITTGAQTLNAAGAFTGELDTSGLQSQASITLEARGLAADKSARVAIEDYTQPDASDALPVHVFHFTSDLGEGVKRSIRYQEHPTLRIGAAGSSLRASLLAIDADTEITVTATLDAEPAE